MAISRNANQKWVSENSSMNQSGLKYFPLVPLKWAGDFVEKEERLIAQTKRKVSITSEGKKACHLILSLFRKTKQG